MGKLRGEASEVRACPCVSHILPTGNRRRLPMPSPRAFHGGEHCGRGACVPRPGRPIGSRRAPDDHVTSARASTRQPCRVSKPIRSF